MTDFFYTDLAGFDSTAISKAAWNANDERMFIEFIGGNQRIYKDVPANVWNAFVDADSAGRFYNQEFYGEYDSKAVYGVTLYSTHEVAATPTVVNFPTVNQTTSLYAVHWENAGSTLGGKPEFEASSEADAIAQFEAAMAVALSVGLGADDVKVTAVTHYLD